MIGNTIRSPTKRKRNKQHPMKTKKEFEAILKQRILLLDGGFGSMLQAHHLTEEQYRGTQYADAPMMQLGNNDMLNVTQPEIVAATHRAYLEAGADIITASTFNSTAISLADYGMTSEVRTFNLAAARLARHEADQYSTPSHPRLVAGSVGPTSKSISIGDKVEDPAHRAIDYAEMLSAYIEQIDALIEGGVDLILFETFFDTLNLKAGLDAAMHVAERRGEFAVMVSATLGSKGGRLLSGQTLEALLITIAHCPLIASVGLNCSFGAADMKPFVAELGRLAPYYISSHPNAGLPNVHGGYDETPAMMAAIMQEYLSEGLLNIIGGCCGTTPEHIAAFSACLGKATIHRPAEAAPQSHLQLAGLEPMTLKPEHRFLVVGERCNVAGSRRFLRLIKEKNYAEALEIARRQVEDGALVIDINMDDALLETRAEIVHFLHLVSSDPDVARVPLMIDSSKWAVIAAALECVQGKCIVNSISLKEGEALFLAHARHLRRFGAAVVVMAFDEQGQADTLERRIEICQRSYRLLTEQAAFPPQDIIFDPNVLAVATGIAEHNSYGIDFIEATRWIKQNLPGAKVSGGISNLSFSFRGNNPLREAIHSVFLHHAIEAGLDMGIVNAAEAMIYDDIDPTLRSRIEDVVLNRHAQSTDALIEYASSHISAARKGDTATDDSQRLSLTIEERFQQTLIKGIATHLEADIAEALEQRTAVVVIDQLLMPAMQRVGELFGEGKMFLPQVVKSARTMRHAVQILEPTLIAQQPQGASSKAGRIIFATVKGDVHDIGKNIVSIVLQCNNFEVIDLGVMVPTEAIIEAVGKHKPDLLCLSGLITPSLDEMARVAQAMNEAGYTTPIIIGGATTSKEHTALKLAPIYKGVLAYVTDASQNAFYATELLHPERSEAFIEGLRKEYQAVRERLAAATVVKVSPDEARHRRAERYPISHQIIQPHKLGHHTFQLTIEQVAGLIDWGAFFAVWGLSGVYAAITRIHGCDACRAQWLADLPLEQRAKGAEAMQLFKEAQRMLNQLAAMGVEFIKATIALLPCHSDGKETITIDGHPFMMPRQLTDRTLSRHLSLADFVAQEDYLGLFAITAGAGAQTLLKRYQAEDPYRGLLLQVLLDRLAEAASEYIHRLVRTDYWGYAPNELLTTEEILKCRYQGIRPAIGYPSLPDQALIFEVAKVIDLESIGITLTDSGAMNPAPSVCGFYFAHPKAKYFQL